jgi:hypothetical protein
VSRVLNMLLMAVAIVWGISALAVVVIFTADERAFRRRSAEQPPPAQTPAPSPSVAQTLPVPARHLSPSTAS